MDRLDELGADAEPPDQDVWSAVDLRFAVWGRPLGRISEVATWWAGVRGQADAKAPTKIVHIGPAEALDLLGTVSRGDITRTVELTPPPSIDAAITWGVELADRLADEGVELLVVTGADREASIVVAALLMGLDAVDARGWPTDRPISDADWMVEVEQVRDGLRMVDGLRGRPADLLAGAGSASLAALSALLVQATVRRLPAMLDGLGAAAAALTARRSILLANKWWQAAHLGPDPLHARILTSLNLTPLSKLGTELEDGTGLRLGLDVLQVAAYRLGQLPAAPEPPAAEPVAEPSDKPVPDHAG